MNPQLKQGRWGLKGKLITAMLLVGAAPLLIGLGMAFLQGTRELHEAAGASFASLASESARSLDLVFSDELMRMIRIATHPIVVSALEERDDDLQQRDEPARLAAIEASARRWEAREPAFVKGITGGKVADLFKNQVARPDESAGPILPAATRAATKALFLTDSSGALVASLNEEIAYQHADEEWWRATYQNAVGQPYLSNIVFDERAGTYVFHLSVPVMDSIRYRAIGVLHRVFDAKEYLGPSLFPIRFGKTGHVMLIDSNGIVMLCPILPTGVKLADDDLIGLVTPLQAGWVKAPTDGHGGRSTSIIGHSPLPGTSRLTRQSTGATWHTFVWEASEELFAPTRHFFAWVAGFGLVALALLAALGYGASVHIVTPIRRLQESATLIGRGQLTEPISIRTGDELQQLAEEMNRMNAQLMKTFSGLSDTVEEQAKEVRSLQIMNQQILDSVPHPIVLLGDNGQVDYLNHAAHRAFADSDGHPVGLTLEALLGLDQSTAQRLHMEMEAQQKGLSAPPAEDGIEEARDPLAPKPSTVWHRGSTELRINHRIYRYQWFRINTERNEQARIGLVFQDITDERRLQEKVVQAEKSSGLSVLASGIGHELNNPLSGILGFSEAIADESDLAVIKDHAKAVVAQAKRMADVITGLTGQRDEREESAAATVTLNEVVADIIEQLRSTGRVAGLDIQTQYGSLPPIAARPDEIRQVLINVLTNAVQAMNGKGTLKLVTGTIDGHVSIRIEDTGCGIPSPYLHKVFDPFFTTKKQGEGRGLGLTTARRIVESVGGDISIESKEGQGTAVVILFPAVDLSHIRRAP
ncbi:MAG: HAMP domain-containing protein [Nitrospiraceae bacterium]|nr:HAMP domain-containing protein [Nitrospiraceae bacterium]